MAIFEMQVGGIKPGCLTQPLPVQDSKDGVVKENTACTHLAERPIDVDERKAEGIGEIRLRQVPAVEITQRQPDRLEAEGQLAEEGGKPSRCASPPKARDPFAID